MEHPLAGVNGTKEPVPGILYLRQPEKSVSSVRNDISRTVISLENEWPVTKELVMRRARASVPCSGPVDNAAFGVLREP
jgi:hypothetical protein